MAGSGWAYFSGKPSFSPKAVGIAFLPDPGEVPAHVKNNSPILTASFPRAIYIVGTLQRVSHFLFPIIL